MFNFPDYSCHQEQGEETTEKRDKELYQVHKVTVLREGDLYLYGPGEVTDVDKEGDVRIVVEVKLFIGESVFTFLDIGLGDDGNLFSGLGASCKAWRPRYIQVEVLGGVDEHVQVSVLLFRGGHKVDGSVVSVVLLG